MPPQGPGTAPDRPCLRCGYTLFGLPVSGACPECGAPVASSLRGRSLRHSDPAHLAALHRGVLAVEGGIALGVGCVLLLIVWGILGGASRTGLLSVLPVSEVLTLGSTLGGLMSLMGWWIFTRPDPAIDEMDSARGARRVVRAAAACIFMWTLGSLLEEWTPIFSGGGAMGLALTYALAGIKILGAVAWLVHLFAVPRLLQLMAPRLEDPPLAKQAARAIWLIPLVAVLGGLILGLGLLVAFALYLDLIDNARSALKRLRRDVARGSAELSVVGAAGPVPKPPAGTQASTDGRGEPPTDTTR
jgi:hypothetical protein